MYCIITAHLAIFSTQGSVGFDCVLCEGSIAVLVEISKNNESEVDGL